MRNVISFLLVLCLVLLLAALPIVSNGAGEASVVPVVGNPYGIAYDSSNHMIYVSNQDGYIQQFDPSTASVTVNLTLGNDPSGAPPQLYDLTYSNYTGYLYADDFGLPGVWIVNPSSGAVVGTVALSNESLPVALAFDSKDIYVVSGTTNSVYVVDQATRKVVANVSVNDAPNGIAYDPSNGDLYVPCAGSNTTLVIDSNSNQVIASIPVPGTPWAATAVPGGFVYVAENTAGQVAVINPATNTVVSSVATGASPWSFTQVPGQVWVADNGDGTITQIDIASSSYNGTIYGLQSPTSLSYDPFSGNVYAVEDPGEGAGSVAIIPLTTENVTTSSASTTVSTYTSSAPVTSSPTASTSYSTSFTQTTSETAPPTTSASATSLSTSITTYETSSGLTGTGSSSTSSSTAGSTSMVVTASSSVSSTTTLSASSSTGTPASSAGGTGGPSSTEAAIVAIFVVVVAGVAYALVRLERRR